MTNPAIAQIRTALPLVYTLGLWGEVLAFLFFSDPGGGLACDLRLRGKASPRRRAPKRKAANRAKAASQGEPDRSLQPRPQQVR